ncbi:MAG TPA: hypothetical protein VFK54_01400 [Candidatus Limnocylindrales bacterium]|nr:hypothetical protein [Candidatus Limnocylindrales bacterium]
MSRLLRLYPASWRDRYGDELLDLLAARPPSVLDSIDIVRGALDARLHPQLLRERGAGDRRFVAPLLGGVLLGVAWLIALNGPVQSDEFGTYRDGAAAMPFWLASMILLATGFLFAMDRLPVSARVGRGAAVVAALGALTWSVGPWLMTAGAVMLAATAVLAVAGIRQAAWPRLTSVALVLVAAAPAGYLAWSLTRPWYVNRLAEPVIIAATMLSVAAVWPLLAVILARTPRRPATPTVAVVEAVA